MDNKPVKKWRANCFVTYADKNVAQFYRKQVLETLRGIAYFRGIECEISLGHPVPFEKNYITSRILKESVSDLVYFRSSPQSKISSGDFQKIIDLVFEGYQIWLTGSQFEVTRQLKKLLKLYPYPES